MKLVWIKILLFLFLILSISLFFGLSTKSERIENIWDYSTQKDGLEIYRMDDEYSIYFNVRYNEKNIYFVKQFEYLRKTKELFRTISIQITKKDQTLVKLAYTKTDYYQRDGVTLKDSGYIGLIEKDNNNYTTSYSYFTRGAVIKPDYIQRRTYRNLDLKLQDVLVDDMLCVLDDVSPYVGKDVYYVYNGVLFPESGLVKKQGIFAYFENTYLNKQIFPSEKVDVGYLFKKVQSDTELSLEYPVDSKKTYTRDTIRFKEAMFTYENLYAFLSGDANEFYKTMGKANNYELAYDADYSYANNEFINIENKTLFTEIYLSRNDAGNFFPITIKFVNGLKNPLFCKMYLSDNKNKSLPVLFFSFQHKKSEIIKMIKDMKLEEIQDFMNKSDNIYLYKGLVFSFDIFIGKKEDPERIAYVEVYLKENYPNIEQFLKTVK